VHGGERSRSSRWKSRLRRTGREGRGSSARRKGEAESQERAPFEWKEGVEFRCVTVCIEEGTRVGKPVSVPKGKPLTLGRPVGAPPAKLVPEGKPHVVPLKGLGLLVGDDLKLGATIVGNWRGNFGDLVFYRFRLCGDKRTHVQMGC
jgi:hypothetical protein